VKRVAVVGAGFGGISAAAYLAQAGCSVTVYEKNGWVGGRARLLERDGFRLDMGPSWYWMPAEHDSWFADLGVAREDYYGIRRVDPSYKVYYGQSPPNDVSNIVTMPADFAAACDVFERYEPGAGERLRKFVDQARVKYEFAMSGFIYRNFNSMFDMLTAPLVRNITRLNFLKSYRSLIRRSFSHPYLQKILEFPVVFLGSSAVRTPAVYTLMNYIDFGLGTWYPDGGFAQVVRSMQRVAESLGARFEFNSEVTAMRSERGLAKSIELMRAGGPRETVDVDVVVANADYVHVETDLLSEPDRSIPRSAWSKRTFAPAVLNFYVGLNRRLTEIEHHTFFFDTDWDAHFDAVYGRRRWPEAPLFYLHVPSKTDPDCAPEGKEAVFILIPCAVGLEDGDEVREAYFDRVVDRIEELSGEPFRKHIEFRESMSIREFRSDYNAHMGTAFGLGQTLFQTALFRPRNRSRKLSNLYFAGHYTVPGTGTTMSMISGKLAAMRIRREWLDR
jgi:phytoene desaturase